MADRNRNPRNEGSPLFRRLTRLFSGPLVNYDAQMVVRNSRSDTDKFASKFKSASGQQFKKTSYNPFSNLTSATMANVSRSQRYIDFDQMEYEPIIASALDIYADEMTTSTHLHPLLRIHCPNEEIKLILNSLYHNVLNIEHNLFNWCRTMCKFGDFMLYLDIEENQGVVNAIGLPTREVERLEGEDKTNPNYIQYQWNSAGMTFENWQIAHFRILGNDKFAPYGTSILDPARRIFRQLSLLEDAMMSYRIVRSPERRVFYVDVGGINPNEVEQYMQKVVTQMKRNQVVDSSTGRVDLRYNPMSVDEDYFIPVRGGQSTKIETLAGGQYTGDIDDVKYLKDKLFSALKIPQSYLFRGEGANEDQTTLAQKDIRFARTIQRLQRAVITELEKIGIIHLYTLGYRGNDLISFKMSLNNPSKIAELQELEQWRTKFDVASAAAEGFFSKRWIADNLFNISEEEFLRNQREIAYDKIMLAQFDVLDADAGTGGGGGAGGLGGGDLLGLGDDTGGDDLGDALGGDEAETPTPDETPAETPAAEEPEGNLLAVPGNRDDEVVKMATKGPRGKVYTTTNRSKGKWYEPRGDSDKRALARSMKSQGSMRGITGIPHGYKDMKRLARGVSEDQQSNYDMQEQQILEHNNEIKKLITELETKQNVKQD